MSPTDAVQRPRTGVLAFAGIALIGAVAYSLWPAASLQAPSSNQPREQRSGAGVGASAQGPLEVRLEDLKQPPPEPGGEGRNPFRFYVKPPPPAPPPPVVKPPDPVVDTGPPPPPQPPPIPLKFIGTMEQGKKKVAIFSDGRGVPVYGSEGELVLGQYR